ncbi:ORF6N domain-containing protein [Enterobacteriaceae bacterium LUAb1]
MTTQISAETISPITHNQIPVITTELLAQLYGAEVNSIQQNFKRNASRFVAGKHFYKLEGTELRQFKDKLTDSQLVAPRAKHLILWTERGAARHAKMLETDQAWEVFEKLEDCYFNQPDKKSSQVTPVSDEHHETRYRVQVIIHDDLFGGAVEFPGRADSMRAIACGIATDLGYKPTGFISVPAKTEKMKRIH